MKILRGILWTIICLLAFPFNVLGFIVYGLTLIICEILYALNVIDRDLLCLADIPWMRLIVWRVDGIKNFIKTGKFTDDTIEEFEEILETEI